MQIGMRVSENMMKYYWHMFMPQGARDEMIRRMNALEAGELQEYSMNQMIQVCNSNNTTVTIGCCTNNEVSIITRKARIILSLFMRRQLT